MVEILRPIIFRNLLIRSNQRNKGGVKRWQNQRQKNFMKRKSKWSTMANVSDIELNIEVFGGISVVRIKGINLFVKF